MDEFLQEVRARREQIDVFLSSTTGSLVTAALAVVIALAVVYTLVTELVG